MAKSPTPMRPDVKTTSGAVANTDTDRVDFLTPAYERMEVRWTKCRALMTGIEAIREGGEEYLTRFESETDDDVYDERTQLAALYNGFARTVLASVGLLLHVEPSLGSDMPQPLVDLWEDVDGAGTHGRVFCRDLVLDGIVDGHDGIFVDYMTIDQANTANASAAAQGDGAALSADDEKLVGLRPYFVHYKADAVIRTLYQTINGVRTLVLLILRETVDERFGDFGYKTVTRYRAYTNNAGEIACRIYRASDGSAKPELLTKAQDDTMPDDGITVMQNVTEIPWCPLRAGQKISEIETKPPLLDLADLNIEHHQTKTNILNLATLAMVPTPVRIGAKPDDDGEYPPMVLGPRSTIEAPIIQGVAQPIYWLSPPVEVLQPAMNMLEKTEAAMGAAGMAFLAPQTRAAETAQAREIDSRAQNATLSMINQALQDCLESAFEFAGDFLKIVSGSVTVSSEFERALMEASAMLAYVALVQQGFPKRLALEALQAGGRIKPDADLDELELEWEGEVIAEAQRKADEAAAQAEMLKARTQTPPIDKTGDVGIAG